MEKRSILWIGLLSLTFIILISGCSEADKYIQRHPELSDRIKDDIRNGRISKGMTRSDVRVVVGRYEPDDKFTWKPDPFRKGRYLISDNSISDESNYTNVAWMFKEYQYEGKLRAMEDKPPGVLFGVEYANEKTGKYREIFVFFKGDIVQAVGKGEMKDPDQEWKDIMKRLGLKKYD